MRSIMIIDGDFGFAGSLGDMLAQKGYAVSHLATAEAAALAVLREPPDGGVPPPVAPGGQGPGATWSRHRRRQGG